MPTNDNAASLETLIAALPDIRRRIEAITAGNRKYTVSWGKGASVSDAIIAEYSTSADTEFIAHAPADVSTLLALVDALLAER